MAGNEIEKARFNMIEQQIRPWEVLDRRVLDTLSQVPREKFVPQAYLGLAFADVEIPIGHGESMMAPRIEARMLQSLAIKASDKVLEIGTGSGFVTACLARLGSQVTSVDVHADFIDSARERLRTLGINNVELDNRDGLESPIGTAPYDAIAITGSVTVLGDVDGLKQQLNIGGRMFVIVGESPIMEALLVTRVDSESRVESLFDTRLAALAHVPAHEHFTF